MRYNYALCTDRSPDVRWEWKNHRYDWPFGGATMPEDPRTKERTHDDNQFSLKPRRTYEKRRSRIKHLPWWLHPSLNFTGATTQHVSTFQHVHLERRACLNTVCHAHFCVTSFGHWTVSICLNPTSWLWENNSSLKLRWKTLWQLLINFLAVLLNDIRFCQPVWPVAASNYDVSFWIKWRRRALRWLFLMLVGISINLRFPQRSWLYNSVMFKQI